MSQSNIIAADEGFYTGNAEPPEHASVYIPPGDIRKEEYRLATFKYFPKVSPARRFDLAASGFYYIGYKDRVKCFCCGATVNTRVIIDNPRESKWHETVRDFSNLRDAQNIPMHPGLLRRQLFESEISTQTKLSISSRVSRRLSTTNPQHPTSDVTSLEYAARQQPRYPHMRSLQARRESFQAIICSRWPAHKLRAKVNEVAAAGFYYCGQQDRVKCWFCNGGIQNWEYDDEPWIEHAKWFPRCEFVRIVKGDAFVQQVTSRHPNIRRPVPSAVPAHVSMRNSQRVTAITSFVTYQNKVIMTVQNALPQLTYVTKATEMGYNVDGITDVLVRKYRQDGDFFHSDMDFFEALFSAEDLQKESHSSPRLSVESSRDVQKQDERQQNYVILGDCNVIVFGECLF